MINKITKRLLTASALKVTFDYCGIKRYIEFNNIPAERENFFQKLTRNNITPKQSVYGNIVDCLDYLDELLVEMKEDTLEQQFDINGLKWGIDINWEEK